MPTLYDVARQLKTAGVVTTAHFDPSTLTVRIRKAAQRMLSSGVLRGGWNSQSRKVAEIVATHHDLPMVRARGGYVYVEPRTLNDQDLEEVERLVHADITAFKLNPEVPEYYIEKGKYKEYIDERAKRQLSGLDNFERHGVDYVYFLDEAFAKQLGEYIAAKVDNDSKRQKAAAFLDSTTCIPLALDYNF